MERTIDKLILFAASCTIYIYISSVNAATVTAILLTVIFGCAGTLIDMQNPKDQTMHMQTKRRLLTASLAGYTLLTLAVPNMCLFLPFIFYDIFRYRLKVSGIFAAACLIYQMLHMYVMFDVIEFLLFLFAFLLQNRSSKNETLSKEMIHFRDTVTEQKLLLEQNQKMILQQQDSMIYTATLKERNRIAREIHDNVGHLLTRSILMVGAIKTIEKNPAITAPLDALHSSLNDAMTSIRSSVHDLHDDSIDLYASILDILRPIHQFEIDLDYDAGNNIPRNVKYSFIAIIKECTTNTIKHSNASHMDIILREHPGFYQLLIRDNGTNISSSHTSGIGLINIRDRVRALNGTLQITTESGFQIFVSFMKDRLPEPETD